MDYYDDQKPLDVATATEMIRGIAKMSGGGVEYSDHCRYKSMPDSNFLFQDLMAILLNGEVRENPERDRKTGQFKYKMVGETIDGDPATVVVVILSHRSLRVITVFGG
jgi:hypothetical protein